jgi:MGT family glycosyltransferase
LSQNKIQDAGFAYRAFAKEEFTIEETRRQLRVLAELHGLKAMRYTVDVLRRRTAACLREVPEMARADGVEMMLVDQVSPEGAAIAEHLRIPFATMSNALVLHIDSAVPPCFTPWKFSKSPLAKSRNWLANKLLRRLTRPVMHVVNQWRTGHGLAPWHTFADAHSPLLQISQQPREFEYPRELPKQLHFVGPMFDQQTRERSNFPFEKLDGRPLIYASMGTLQNRVKEIFTTIAQACAGLPAQLVIALGGGATPDVLGELPGSPVVVEFAPQLELIQRAELCITHAGLNTALECLAHGVPMVAIPITNDQPGVAARIAWCGAGKFILPGRLTAKKLAAMIEKVMREDSYRENARRLQSAIAKTRGAARAAELIEVCVTRGAGGTTKPSPQPSAGVPGEGEMRVTTATSRAS